MERIFRKAMNSHSHATDFMILAAALLLLYAGPSHAQAAADEAAIRAAIAQQAAAWNQGDIPAFTQAYEDSPDTTFIGATLRKGYAPILARYKQAYTTPEQMGTLTFSNLEVRLLDSSCGKTEFAVVTGSFHLERAQKGEAKKDDGNFSLVWRKGAQGWKIVLDHTS
jgi:uncharacterized protein (TIGR02246 family)